MSNAKEYMKRLRERRKEKSLCTRCGKKAMEGKAECEECKKYRIEYKKKNPKINKEPKIIRELKTWEVTNPVLYKKMLVTGTTTKDLANLTGVAQRNVERWIFENAFPNDENALKVNEYFKCDIYKIQTKK